MIKNKEKILYYITDHGRGHATRSIAIIRELQKYNVEIIVRNSNLGSTMKKSLPKIKIISGITDVGPIIQNNGISINYQKSKKIIHNWIENLEFYAEKESRLIDKINPQIIISDISVMPILAAKKSNKISIAISNFSWYDALKFLSSKDLMRLKKIYQFAEFAIKLNYGTSMNHFNKIFESGLICRKPTKNKNEIRKLLGIKNSEKIILFAIGKSKEEITFLTDTNTKIISTGSMIDKKIPHLKINNWIEGQNLVSVADVVICKCGYGMISECLTTGTPFYYIADNNHLEQKNMSMEIQKLGYKNRIKFEDISKMKINKPFFQSQIKFKKHSIETKKIVQKILELT